MRMVRVQPGGWSNWRRINAVPLCAIVFACFCTTLVVLRRIGDAPIRYVAVYQMLSSECAAVIRGPCSVMSAAAVEEFRFEQPQLWTDYGIAEYCGSLHWDTPSTSLNGARFHALCAVVTASENVRQAASQGLQTHKKVADAFIRAHHTISSNAGAAVGVWIKQRILASGVEANILQQAWEQRAHALACRLNGNEVGVTAVVVVLRRGRVYLARPDSEGCNGARPKIDVYHVWVHGMLRQLAVAAALFPLPEVTFILSTNDFPIVNSKPVDAGFVETGLDEASHIKHLLQSFPDVAQGAFTSTSSPDTLPFVPVFSPCTTARHWDIPVPHGGYASGTEGWVGSHSMIGNAFNLAALSSQTPWQHRQHTAIFRGTSYCYSYSNCSTCSRLEAACTYFETNVGIDIGVKEPAPKSLFDGCRKNMPRACVARNISVEQVVSTPFMPLYDHVQHTMLISFDGHTHTQRLAKLFLFDSVVLRQRTSYIEFLDTIVQPGAHYVPFDCTSTRCSELAAVVHRVQGDDKHYATYASDATSFVWKHLVAPSSRAAYWYALLWELQSVLPAAGDYTQDYVDARLAVGDWVLFAPHDGRPA